MRQARQDWFERGPLGLDNYRKQLGRSDILCTARQKNKAILLQAGATQNLRGDDTQRAVGDAAASAMQISCTYRPDNDAALARPLQVRGLIQWGTDGHQAESYFDWLNGTVIQVSGSFVRVIAEIVDNLGAGESEPTHDPDAQVTVGATLGYWNAARLAPTLTQQLRLVGADPGPAAVVVIPRFARRLWWTGPVLTDVQWAIGPGAGMTLGAVDPAGMLTRQGYERPGNATHLQITGNVTTTLNTLTWELVL